MAQGWVGRHIGAAWGVFYEPVWLMAVPLGPHMCPQQGGCEHARRRRDQAPRRTGGTHGPVGVMLPSQEPRLACLSPKAHSKSHLASVWAQTCRGPAMRTKPAPASYVASWPNNANGGPGKAHEANAMNTEHDGCWEDVQ